MIVSQAWLWDRPKRLFGEKFVKEQQFHWGLLSGFISPASIYTPGWRQCEGNVSFQKQARSAVQRATFYQ